MLSLKLSKVLLYKLLDRWPLQNFQLHKLYINDIQNDLASEVLIYADDTNYT